MVKKIVFLAGVGVGYLVGSKAGREKLMQLWQDPKVQDSVSQGAEWAKEKAPGLQEKLSEAASTAKDKVAHATSHESQDPGPGASNGSFTSGGNQAMAPAEAQPEAKL